MVDSGVKVISNNPCKVLGPKPTWNYEKYKQTLVSNNQEIQLFYLWYNSRIRWLITINLHCSRFSRLITVKLLPLNERLECKPIDRSRRHTVGADRRQPTASCIFCAAVRNWSRSWRKMSLSCNWDITISHQRASLNVSQYLCPHLNAKILGKT